MVKHSFNGRGSFWNSKGFAEVGPNPRVVFFAKPVSFAGIDSKFFRTRNAIESMEASGWWADCILQTYGHQRWAVDAIRQIHGVKIAQCSQCRLPVPVRLISNPLIHFRPVCQTEIVDPVAEKRDVSDAVVDPGIKSRSRECKSTSLATTPDSDLVLIDIFARCDEIHCPDAIEITASVVILLRTV